MQLGKQTRQMISYIRIFLINKPIQYKFHVTEYIILKYSGERSSISFFFLEITQKNESIIKVVVD